MLIYTSSLAFSLLVFPVTKKQHIFLRQTAKREKEPRHEQKAKSISPHETNLSLGSLAFTIPEPEEPRPHPTASRPRSQREASEACSPTQVCHLPASLSFSKAQLYGTSLSNYIIYLWSSHVTQANLKII